MSREIAAFSNVSADAATNAYNEVRSPGRERLGRQSGAGRCCKLQAARVCVCVWLRSSTKIDALQSTSLAPPSAPAVTPPGSRPHDPPRLRLQWTSPPFHFDAAERDFKLFFLSLVRWPCAESLSTTPRSLAKGNRAAEFCFPSALRGVRGGEITSPMATVSASPFQVRPIQFDSFVLITRCVFLHTTLLDHFLPREVWPWRFTPGAGRALSLEYRALQLTRQCSG